MNDNYLVAKCLVGFRFKHKIVNTSDPAGSVGKVAGSERRLSRAGECRACAARSLCLAAALAALAAPPLGAPRSLDHRAITM